MPITKFKNEKEKEKYLEELKKERNTSNNSNKRIYHPTNVDLEKKSSSSKNLKQSIKETEKNNSLPKASETNSLPTASNKEYLSRNTNIPTLSLQGVTKSKIGIENNVNRNENKNNISNNSQAKNNYYLSDLPTANSFSKYKLKKEENTEETVKNIDELSPAELEAYNIPITSNNDARLALMKKKAWEYDVEDYKNLAELNQVSQQKYAENINEFAEKHPILAGLYNTEMNVANGMYSVVSGTNNLANTAELWMAKGAEKLGQLTQNEELVNKAQATYDKTLAESNYLASTGNFISGGNQGIDNNIIRTAGNVGNVVGSQLMSAGIGEAAGIAGSTMQAIGTAGSSMQEVLAENPDNLLQATVTGTLKGIASKKIEDLFDANILSINGSKSSVQNQVTKWISNTFKTNIGKNIADKVSGVIGENAEEFIEDNVDNIIDKLVNNKDLPNFNEWWNNTTETAKITTISTTIMSLLGLGGDSFENKEARLNSETKFWINEVQKIIDNEKMAISKNVGNTLLNQLADNTQNSGNIQSKLNQQQITPQETKTAQNENMEQNKDNIVYDIDNERSSLNNYRLQLPSETKTTSNQSITSQDENVNYINNYAQQGENNTNNVKNTHSELSDMLNNKDLPMQYYQYEKSENVKVNTLKESASKYFNNSEQTKNYISMLEQIVTDKNIEIRFEDNLKTPDGKIANGSYSDGVITINPNSSGTGEFIAVHELTHAIGTNEMVKMIENFKNSNVEFSTEMKSLLDNYSSTEINEEALADVSAQLLGNQEFINNVAQNNSNIFKKIYSEIKYLWHQFRGYKNQNQFVEDLYYKWTKAYNSSNELNSTTNYSIAGKKGVENLINSRPSDSILLEQMYNKAQLLQKNGVDNESIRQQTNWFQDKNGDWKFEFTDSNMALKTNIELKNNTTYKLGEILEHDTLFMVYPELANYDVKILCNTNANGSFNKNSKTINISDKLIKNNKLVEGTLIHEIQHAIQNIEGFERGKSSKKSKLAYYNSLGEIEATDTKTRFLSEKYNNKNMESVAPESSKQNPQHKNLNKYLKNRNILDKIKDSVYNYFNGKSDGGSSSEINQEIIWEDTKQNNSLVDGRGRIENELNTKYSIQESENNSDSFNLDKNAKRYEDLILADNIKYNKRADDNINVEICNNNELINQFVITSKNDAIKQLGQSIADHIYGTANNNIKSLELSKETTVDVTDTSHKGKQLAIIKENNPMLDDYHVGIRSVEDIKTFDEVINDEESFVWGDFSKEDAENALKQGKITVYSSYPIKQGTFVSTSKIQAEQYAGGNNSKVYSKTIPLNEVAWINGDEGQYAKVSSEKYSTQANSSWYDYLERTFPNKGTRTYAKDILVKKADNEGSYSTKNKKSTNSRHVFRNDIKSAIFNAENTPHGLYVSDLYDKDINAFSKPHKNEIQNTDYDFYVEPKNPLMLKGRDAVIERIGEEVSADTGTQALKELIGDSKYEQLTQMDFEELKKYAINKFSQYDWTTCTDKGDILSGLGSSLAREYGYDSIIPPRSKYRNNEWLSEVEDIENEMVILKNELLENLEVKNNTNNIANSLNTIYNNAKLGEVKQVPVETLLSIQNSTGGYRTQEQINNLKSDIRANGITTPIEIYKKSDGTFAIENGNHRLEIAQELGIKEVPVKLVKSWNDVGISKENVSGIDSNKVEDKYNDRITRENSRFNDNSWNREGSMSNNNVQLENSGRTGRNAELYETTSNSNEFTSSNENKGNNRQQEVDDSTSFNMSNNAPSFDNNSFGTSTEENSWSRQQAEKKKKRKHYESIIKSNYTTDEAKAIAKELMGTDTYVPESNSRQLEVADERIASAGADSELNSLMSRATTGGNIKSDDIAIGERLIQYYSKTGDKFKLQEAIQATAMAGTTAGQTVQAMALLNHQTPEGQAIWLQRSVDKMNSDLKKTRGKNAEQFNLTAEMLEKVASSENAKVLEENLNEVYKELGQQVTKTTAQKIDAWRYFSMLSSPKTHIRNITGNTAMAGVQGIKNKVAGTIEGVVGKFNSDMERTHTLKIASKEVKSFAKADIENVADRLGLNENKYNPKTRLENNMRTFKSDFMEKTVGKVFEINNNLLEAEDGWGLKAGYVKALSEYMTSNNLTPDTITDKQLSKARNYAVEQAKEATFHQDSKLASMINQFSNKNKFCKFILDSTLPFKKTPINVAKAGIEYSPVGLVKSAVYDTVKLRKGDITVNKYIDNISKGLTGTGIALVGYALADCGILKASGSDDEDRESFEEGRGSQNYSITIGDNTYSLDWLAPSGIPLFIGAECYELMQASSEKKTSSSDDDKIHNQIIESATNILDSFANAMNPMAEMSMLSGLTSALKSYEQGSSKIIAQFGINATKSYVNQFFPTGLGQIAKTIDGYERSTTSTKTSGLPKAIDTTKNQIMSKIPVLRELLPVKTDTWGAEMKQSDNVLVRALENSVLPWTRKELNSTDVDKEILSVYENTGESSVFPDSINKNITIDKQKYTMTAGEYAKYKQQYGQTSYNLLNSLIKSSEYKKLSDEQKQLAIEKIYSYSTEQIKVDYAKRNRLSYKQSTISSVVNSIKKMDGNTSNYFEFLAKTQDLTKESEKVEILANSNYSNNTKTAIYENSLGKDDSSYKILKKSFTDKGLNITKYLKYVSQEFTSDKEDDGTVDGKPISGSKKDKVIDYIDSISGTTYTQRILLYGLKYKPESISDRELIVNYIRDNWTGSERTEMFKQFTWIKKYKNGNIGY